MRGKASDLVVASLAIASAAILAPTAKADIGTTYLYKVYHDSWSNDDERDYRNFVAALGESDCNTLDACLHSAANPYLGSDPPGLVFQSDCAELPYILRFYFAWKRGLPFSYESAVRSRGSARDVRYSIGGNEVAARFDVPSGVMGGAAIITRIRETISSASYRIHPDLESPLEPDLYSPAIRPDSIRPGTIVYDPAGHVGIVFSVDPRGRVHFLDAHTDFSLTQMTYDLRFTRMSPFVGAGFKNWRPIRLVGATRRADGVLVGGHIEMAANEDIADFSDEQFFGNGKRPRDSDWKSGTFTLNGERLDYYDYVRAQLAGGKLLFEPVAEIGDIARSLCIDLNYRAQAVQLAVMHGIQNGPEPGRLPYNIYGAEGDWETFSTPSRDARLKTEFKSLRDTVQRFVEMASRDDAHLSYDGTDLPADLLRAYDQETKYCRVTYATSDGSHVTLSYEDARRRLFAMSFDPYQCVERRWGDVDAPTCADDSIKRAWYEAEQNLRNQLERTYDARMDFALVDLLERKPGVASAPDTDVRAYLTKLVQPESAP
jgi:hypothetical protein